jgi:hypothetical protein
MKSSANGHDVDLALTLVTEQGLLTGGGTGCQPRRIDTT